MNESTTALEGLPVMSREELLKVALENGGYSTPSLNDTLYLHYKGYRRIENLDKYDGLKSLWLHSNGFERIENLSHLKELRCLFLQRNAFSSIENLQGLDSLVQLDISENSIRVVEGLDHLPNLTTLNLSKNVLEDAASIQHLVECKNLSAVDLSHNKLAGKDVVACITGIEKLTSLNMSGNPVCSKVAYFRKKMIVANKSLRYLDRPIFDNERATAEEWARAGPGAEQELKAKLLAKKQDKERNAMQEFRQWQESVRTTTVNNNTEVEDAVVLRDTMEALITAVEVKSLLLKTDTVVNEEKQVVEVELAECKTVEKEKENVEPQDDFVAQKVKSLSLYLNSKGQRKTLEDLLVDSSKVPAVVLPPDALSFDVVSSDDDEETDLMSTSS
ncbi:putative dynein axonemal assembly factor 1 [Skeletonema marinoi]|uniref:Dynein axonemal assembly factor 1 n=1 Tax=Skeletonema marinoi TaxID=267567 RepID=A0AAD9D9W6_9STRA|nr:putative dynein axonemal assembly factor 1 [Skeletonema marinoi]